MGKKMIFLPPRRYDAITELLKAAGRVEKAVPVLKLKDLYRDKTKAMAVQ